MGEEKQKIMEMMKLTEKVNAENGVAQTKHFQQVLTRAQNGVNVRFELESSMIRAIVEAVGRWQQRK